MHATIILLYIAEATDAQKCFISSLYYVIILIYIIMIEIMTNNNNYF